MGIVKLSVSRVSEARHNNEWFEKDFGPKLSRTSEQIDFIGFA
jgi:hypothetical protein